MTRQISDCRAVRLVVAVLAIAWTIAAEQLASAQNSNATPAKSAEAELGDFYRGDEVQSVYLRVADEDLQRMLAALPERIYVRASFRWRDISVENVAIRFKGNSSSAPSQQHKRSFLIKFDEYADGQRFLGLRRVSLDNGVQFGSVFSEPIITEILRDQGIKTHRCNYAKLFLNDKYHGVYVNVERIDESFIERHLPDPNGLLFKVDEGGPGANLQFLGDDPSAYARAFEPETKSAKKGQRRLVEFIKLINQSPEKDFAAKLDSKMEVDDFLRVTAVMLFSGAFDQLTGWHPHNYYLYCDGKQDRWRYLPWDLDVGFCEIAFGQIHVLADWNAAWPVAGQMPNPLLERIVADPALLKRYRDTARVILGKYFEPERLCAVIDAKYALIKKDLAADPFPHRRVTNPEDQSYEDIVTSMKSFVRKRYTTASQQLATPGQRPEIVRRPQGGPGGPPPQLVEKLQRIQRAAEQMQKNGKDMLPIHKLMQQVGPLLQQGRTEEAEKLIVQALKLAGEELPHPPSAKDASTDKPSAASNDSPLRIGNQRVGKVLFLGNSITLHSPAPNIGWTGNWGMAASTREKDYVHLLLDRIANAAGGKPAVMVKNIADFERRQNDFNVSDGLKDELAFKADLIVIAIGENAASPKTDDAKAKYSEAFANLLAELKKRGQPTLVVRSCFWADPAKDQIMKKACEDAGGVFVDNSKLGAHESNYASWERKVANVGVGAHPGDIGMQAIADALWSAIQKQAGLIQPK